MVIGYRGIFVIVVGIFLFPEIYLNAYHLLRYGRLWAKTVQRDKETLRAQENCLYVSGDNVYFYYFIGLKFLIALAALTIFMDWRGGGPRGVYPPIIAVILIPYLWYIYCDGVCSLCVVTSEHIFARCPGTFYRLKQFNIQDVSKYGRYKQNRIYSVDKIYVNEKMLKFDFVRGDDALISVLDKVVTKDILERNKVAAKGYGEARERRFVYIVAAVVVFGIPLAYVAFFMIWPRFLR